MKHFLTKVFCTGLMLKSRDSFSVKLVATLIFSNCVGLWDGSQIELEYIPGRDINCCCMGERINMDSTSWWSVITSIKFSTFIQPCMMAACHDQKVNKVTWVSLHFETMTIVSWNTAVALPIAWVLKWRVSALCIPTYSAIAWCAYLSLLFFVPFYSLLLLGIIAHIPYCTEEFFSDRQDLLADSGYAANSYNIPYQVLNVLGVEVQEIMPGTLPYQLQWLCEESISGSWAYYCLLESMLPKHQAHVNTDKVDVFQQAYFASIQMNSCMCLRSDGWGRSSSKWPTVKRSFEGNRDSTLGQKTVYQNINDI